MGTWQSSARALAANDGPVDLEPVLPRALLSGGRWWEIAVVRHRESGLWALATYDQAQAHRTRRALAVLCELRGDAVSVLLDREYVGPGTAWQRKCRVPPRVARALESAVVVARRSRRSSSVPRPSLRLEAA